MSVERIVPNTEKWQAYYANHICRYIFASRLLKEIKAKRILDAACGVGYGTNHLATSTGAQVVGIDRSEEALGIAGRSFASMGARFLSDDCHKLDAASGYGPYDAIVSFETLEHLPQPERFLDSCFKNLQPAGLFIVSSPNKHVTCVPGRPQNPFHEREFFPEEFTSLLTQAGFSNVKLFGQCYTPIGRMRNQVRSELNLLWSNPVLKVGRWLQRALRGGTNAALLPENLDDFEVRAFGTAEEMSKMGDQGPFVAVAVAERALVQRDSSKADCAETRTSAAASVV
jgi:SAM-dependent methyltransferase